jgi:inorganic pyrophosphatase
MKLSLSAVTLLALSGSANAWSSSIRVSGARSLTAAALFGYSTEQAGETATESFRLNFMDEDSKKISPWHDIPLKGEKGYNMIVEIPKMSKAKMEIATKEESNPIAQDIKKGNLRDYHGPIFWNYGCLPQTWEDPNEEHPELKIFGDDGEYMIIVEW